MTTQKPDLEWASVAINKWIENAPDNYFSDNPDAAEAANAADALLAELTRLTALLEWRSMNEAKTDGTEYIGYLGHKQIGLIWYFAPSAHTRGWCDSKGQRVEPFAFMEMPDTQPKEAGK